MEPEYIKESGRQISSHRVMYQLFTVHTLYIEEDWFYHADNLIHSWVTIGLCPIVHQSHQSEGVNALPVHHSGTRDNFFFLNKQTLQ